MQGMPPQATDGAQRGGDWGAVGVRRRGAAEILRDSVAPAAIVVAEDQPGQEGYPETPRVGIDSNGLFGPDRYDPNGWARAGYPWSDLLD